MLKILAVLTAVLAFSFSNLGASPTSYSIISHSINDLGLVSIQGTSCSDSVNIPSAGVYNLSTSCSITSITINGQTVVSPNSGPIVLPLGNRVSISWTSPNVIDIWDIDQTHSPTH